MSRIVAFLATALLFFSFALPSNARFYGNNALIVNSYNPQERISRAMINHASQSGILALEGTVDPNEYLVGPENVVNVMIGSVIPTELPTTVSGALSLPESGLSQASGRSPVEVEQEGITLPEFRFSNATVGISLIQRSFCVHVMDAVARTGRYLVFPISRVGDEVQQAPLTVVITTRKTIEVVEVNVAMPERAFRAEIRDVYQPALRNIREKHIDGTVELVDFILYQTTGSTECNPILRDGDHITVYEREPAAASIESWGIHPGGCRIEGNLTLLRQLVELSGGLKIGANLYAAIVDRTSIYRLVQVSEGPVAAVQAQPLSGNLTIQSLTEGFQFSFSGEIGNQLAVDIAGALAGSSDDIVPYDGDRLVFPRDEGTIYVTGHVPQPESAILVPRMTARRYVDRATEPEPRVENVYIYDGSSGPVRKGLNEPTHSGDTIFVDWLEQLTLSTRQIRSQRIQVIVTSFSAATGVASTIIGLLR